MVEKVANAATTAIEKTANAATTAVEKTANAANVALERAGKAADKVHGAVVNAANKVHGAVVKAADKTLEVAKNLPANVAALRRAAHVKIFNKIRSKQEKRASRIEKTLKSMEKGKTDDEKAEWIVNRFNLIRIIKKRREAAKKAREEKRRASRGKPAMISKKVNKPSKEEKEEEKELEKEEKKEKEIKEEAQEEAQEQVKEPEVVSPVVVKEAEAKASRLLYDLDLE